MKIVSNASPLIFLAKINKLDFLKQHEMLIPMQVIDEIAAGGKNGKEDCMLIENWLRKNRAEVIHADSMKNLPQGLGEGEKAVISLAVEKKIKTVLLDERKARVTARLLGLEPKGTMAVIMGEVREKRITKEEGRNLVLELIKKGYRMNEELIAEFLQKS